MRAMDIVKTLTSLDFWQTVGLIISIAFTLWQAYLYRKQLREDAYARLHNEYIDFINFVQSHPELGLSEFDTKELSNFTSAVGGDLQKAEKVLYACNLLAAVWEHAFLLRSTMPKGQWEGWETWVQDYLRRSKAVREGISICIEWYDPDFVQYAKRLIAEVEESLNRPPL